MARWRVVAAGVAALLAGLAATTAGQPTTRPLVEAAAGDIVDLGALDLERTRRLDVEIRDLPGPQFLLSDKPEYFRTGDGVAMQEDVASGRVRLYVYHVPEPTDARKTISAVIENRGDGDMNFRFVRYAFPTPSGDYHRIGKQGLIDYWTGPVPSQVRRLPVGERMEIDPAMDATVVTRDQLVHGLYEFEIDQPARVTVFQRDPEADSRSAIDALPRLPRVLPGWHASGAGRGLFAGSEREVAPPPGVVYDPADGVRQIVVADGQHDPWIEGRDSLEPGEPIQNKGNYGVMYHLRVPWRSRDGRGFAVVLASNRGDSKWCRWTAAAVLLNGAAVPLPRDAVRFDRMPQAVMIHRVSTDGGADAQGVLELTYSPPGASCLPTPILLIPLDPPR